VSVCWCLVKAFVEARLQSDGSVFLEARLGPDWKHILTSIHESCQMTPRKKGMIAQLKKSESKEKHSKASLAKLGLSRLRQNMKILELQATASLLALLSLTFPLDSNACYAMPMRQGSLIEETSLRTTSDPNQLVAMLEEHNGTRDPVSATKITIDLTTGVFSSVDPFYINSALEPTMRDESIESGFGMNEEGYNIEIGNRGETATLNGPNKVEPFTFPIHWGEPDSTSERHQFATFCGEPLQRVHFFYCTCEKVARSVIIDVSNPHDISCHATD